MLDSGGCCVVPERYIDLYFPDPTNVRCNGCKHHSEVQVPNLCKGEWLQSTFLDGLYWCLGISQQQFIKCTEEPMQLLADNALTDHQH